MKEKSRMMRFLITRESEETVVAILTEERFPNEFGEFVPPVTIEHEGQEYIMKRQWMQDVYLYQPSVRKAINDFLVS